MKKLFELFSGIRMTVIGGLCLLASLALILAGEKALIDPAWGAVIICGFPLLYLALVRLIRQGWVSSALLISIAMLASILIGELFAAGEVAFIMAVGAILEERTTERAKRGIKRLIGLAPEMGRLIGQDGEEMVPMDRIEVGSVLRVLPGETVPVDGKILSGDTSVDQSIVTGESLPVDKAPGDSVFCGTINRFGSIDVRATRVGADSSLQKLIRLVQQAEDRKAPMQRIADAWATWLVPIALTIALATGAITGDLVRAVTILVVFCPCALALATPTTIMAAIGQATKHGVVIKSGEALENMGKVDVIAFDKTGTLTFGSLSISDVLPLEPGLSEDRLLLLAASAESRSEHPLGRAIHAGAEERGIIPQESEDFFMIPGKGVGATVEARPLRLGNAAFLQEQGITIGTEAQGHLEGLRKQGKATVLIADSGRLIGIVALADTLRPSAKVLIEALKPIGVEPLLLTGDHPQAADYLADLVGIDTVRAELLPAGKVDTIEALQQAGRQVCMIGDGVNDAPALKTARVGVAMGDMGSDIAVEAADIALIGDDLSKIAYLKRLSNAAVRLIRGNIALSMTINFVAIVLSALGLLGPISGALVHNAGSVLVVLNAVLLYDRDYGSTSSEPQGSGQR